ncbi:hypothetical protein [Rubrivirga sp. IMCC43871]|uniref:hypothetical protein n=1 Tax=Rubrivirga sp. IMCC43871 TaxID=3391575 RepID=UPI00398FA501
MADSKYQYDPGPEPPGYGDTPGRFQYARISKVNNLYEIHAHKLSEKPTQTNERLSVDPGDTVYLTLDLAPEDGEIAELTVQAGAFDLLPEPDENGRYALKTTLHASRDGKYPSKHEFQVFLTTTNGTTYSVRGPANPAQIYRDGSCVDESVLAASWKGDPPGSVVFPP